MVIQIEAEDPLHDDRLLRMDTQPAVFILLVAIANPVGKLGGPQPKARMDTPLDVLTPDDAFLLCNRGKKRKGEHAGLLLEPEVFHFKIDIDTDQLEGIQHFQRIHRIAGKPADGFGEDQVDLPPLARFKHGVELRPLISVGTAGHIRIGPGIESVHMTGNHFLVMLSLRLQAELLDFQRRTDPAINSDSQRGLVILNGWNRCDCFHEHIIQNFLSCFKRTFLDPPHIAETRDEKYRLHVL